MNRVRSMIVALFVIALASIGMTAQAQYQRPYRISDRDVDQNLRRLDTSATRFKSSLDAALDRSSLNGTQSEDQINRYVQDFDNATSQLRTRFNNRRSVSADVQNVLDRAAFIDTFVRNNRLGRRAESDWQAVRAELDTLATAYSVSWRWDNNGSYPASTYPTTTTVVNPYRVSDRQVDQLIRRIETNANAFRRDASSALDRSRINGTRREDNFNELIQNFENSTDRLRERFNGRNSVAADVQNVLSQAAQIDNFMGRVLRNNTRVQNEWAALRTDLNQLANYYSVSWDWNSTVNSPVYGTTAGLTGTYRLDTSTSQDSRAIAERAVRNLPYNQRQQALDVLLRRLDAPDMIAIEQRGNSITIASSRAPQITLDADGAYNNETYPSGRNARVRTTLTGNRLIIESTGDRATDFSVTFDRVDSNRLYVTRTIYTEGLTQPVTVNTYYNKTSDVAQWSVYNGNSTYAGNNGTNGTTIDNYIVPNGTSLSAVLNTDLSTKQATDGDRFSMTVTTPGPYEGATIDGYVSNVKRSGRITGRSEMTFNFERIRMSNGNSYNFAGFVDTVQTANGETVRVNNEGNVQEGDSRTSTTVKRAAIGTAVGAIIGAIAGGGKGAAIGAAVGAGAGAGSVYVQGQDDLELRSGSQVTLTATGPR